MYDGDPEPARFNPATGMITGDAIIGALSEIN
jgi:hypothetical protein